MKLKIGKYALLVTLVVTLSGFLTLTDENKKNETLVEAISQSIKISHYAPPMLDDEFSKKVFDLYLKRLDYNKKFLIASDVEKLKEYQYQIDDEYENKTFNLFNRSLDILNERIKEAEAYYKEILNQPFNFETDETIELDNEKTKFAKDKEELKESWRKALKYQTLTTLVDLLETKEKAIEKKDTSVEIKSFDVLEKEARDKVLKRQDDWFKNMSQFDEKDRLSLYLNSIINMYDPHTGYFPPNDKENFDIALSGRLEGIGATLREKDGYIEVANIVPGSASWKQGELEVGDKILKVAQGQEEPVDVVDMRLDKAVELIRGKKGTEVRLTVKKVDATMVVISIIRDVVIIEETYAKSVLIKDKKKIGYIKLPKFYLDMNNTGGRSCTEDMKKEIDKLKQESIKGLILDLRDNGGGSLNDVVKIAGLFIKEGPIVQVKARIGTPQILADNDPQVQYSGPLVVMVNYFSASASEILAAAMQDYGRAVIIGSPSTFGKGTVQNFVDLDRFVTSASKDVKPLGAIKITIQKFYRINGGATQLKGVTPDIILPDVYAYLDLGEKDMDNPMPWTEIEPVTFNHWNSSYNMDEIKQKSKLRTDNNSTFKLINENAERLEKQKDSTVYSLNLVKYREEQKRLKEEADKYKSIQKEYTGINVYTLKEDLTEMKTDSSKAVRAKAWHENLKKDVYLFEALSVIKDMM